MTVITAKPVSKIPISKGYSQKSRNIGKNIVWLIIKPAAIERERAAATQALQESRKSSIKWKHYITNSIWQLITSGSMEFSLVLISLGVAFFFLVYYTLLIG